MDERQTNGWSEWGKHVLKELERQENCDAEQWQEIRTIQIDVAMLKIKAGVWGFLAGAIPAVGALIYFIIKNAK